MPFKAGINWAVLLATCVAAPACTVIPRDVKEGKRLPDTLEMCHSMLIDANDQNYLLRAEIKHAQEDKK